MAASAEEIARIVCEVCEDLEEEGRQETPELLADFILDNYVDPGADYIDDLIAALVCYEGARLGVLA